MEASVFLFREFAQFEQGHGERVAERERRGRACRRSQIEGTGFPGNGLRHGEIGEFRQRGCRIPRNGRDRDAEAFRGNQDADQLVAFSAVAEREQQIVFLQHAQIPVHGLHRMDEDGRRSRAGESRRDLFSDMSAFADPAYDDFPPVVQNPDAEADQFGEFRAEMFLEMDKSVDFQLEGFRARLQNKFRIHDCVLS